MIVLIPFRFCGVVSCRRQQVEAKQDEVLEDMEAALGRLGEMSKDINKELKESTE